MKANKETMVYTNGGDTYKGLLKPRSIKQWMQYGKDANQLYAYKGRYYHDNTMYQVVVFDNKVWDDKEMKTRNSNGFIEIWMIV